MEKQDGVELVDGHYNKPHIDSHDMSILHQGWFGRGDFVLDYANNLQASASTTGVNIGPGAGMIQGLSFIVSGVSLPIAAGTSGMNRIDAVVAHYQRDSTTNIENVNLEIVQGTPAYSSATAPNISRGSVESGDAMMLLWTIPVNGTSIGQPSQQFTMFSPGHATGGVQNITGSFQMISNLWNVQYRAYAAGGMVTLMVSATSKGTWDAGAWKSSPLFHYNTRYQDLFETNSPAMSNSSAGPHALEFYVVGNGVNIRAIQATKISGDTWLQGSITWPFA